MIGRRAFFGAAAVTALVAFVKRAWAVLPVSEVLGGVEALASTGATLTVSNTTSKTTIFTHTFPAGSIGANGVVRLVLRGGILNNSGGAVDVSIQVDWGGAQISTLDITGQGSSTDERMLFFDLVLANSAVAVNHVSGNYRLSDPIAAGSFGNIDAADNQVSKEETAVNTAVAQTLTVSLTFSVAAATITFTRRAAVLLGPPALPLRSP